MVHACVIASSNLYEEPRPPRRGSHRPSPPLSAAHPSLSGWHECSTPYQGYYYDRRPSPPEPMPIHDLTGYGATPREDDGWKRSNILPARRSTPSDISDRHGSALARPSLAATAPDDEYWPSRCYKLSPSDSSSASPPVAASRRAAPSKVQPTLELIRQLHGRAPDRYTLEQSILESYARAAPQSAACQSSQKRCMYPGCTKISVSRGLCRGHGGGRRCHVPACTKSAQSRSNFCWAHGGGQRCDVDGCMRSRKSKHFCVAHLDMEGTSAPAPANPASRGRAWSPKQDAETTDHRTASCRVQAVTTTAMAKKASTCRIASPPVRALPSLGQALSSASRSAPNLPTRSKQLLNV